MQRVPPLICQRIFRDIPHDITLIIWTQYLNVVDRYQLMKSIGSSIRVIFVIDLMQISIDYENEEFFTYFYTTYNNIINISDLVLHSINARRNVPWLWEKVKVKDKSIFIIRAYTSENYHFLKWINDRDVDYYFIAMQYMFDNDEERFEKLIEHGLCDHREKLDELLLKRKKR